VAVTATAIVMIPVRAMIVAVIATIVTNPNLVEPKLTESLVPVKEARLFQ
jgi:hypothetical protein